MYVAIEGIDTTGKSTQIALLREIYKDAIFTKEPSDGDFGTKIRELALFGGLDNLTQTLLFLADRANHAQTVVFPNKNRLIISDRSLISGIAYSEIPPRLAQEINLLVAKKPDLAVILTTNESILRARLEKKELDNIENQGIERLLNIQQKIIQTTANLGIKSIEIPCDEPRMAILARIQQSIAHEMRSV